MSTTQNERLRGLLEPPVSGRGLDLEEIDVTPAGKRRVLRVVVDSDDGVLLDTCAELSRELSEVLDASDAMGGASYVLEVTSPGADRPLTAERHFRRAHGRLVKATLTTEAGGGDVTGRLTGADADGVDLEIPGVKGRKPTPRRLAYGEIAKARVEIEFKSKAAEAARSQQESADTADEGRDAGDEGKKEA